MNIANVTQGERGLRIIWNDQATAEFPFVWRCHRPLPSYHLTS